MTTPPTAFVERWVNAGAEAVVLGSQDGGPARAGQAEDWIMGAGRDLFPVADMTTDGSLPRLFRVFDREDPREIMRVIDTTGTGGVWRLVRGDQGTLPVVHRAGAVLSPFITAAGMDGFARAVPPGRGIVVAPPHNPGVDSTAEPGGRRNWGDGGALNTRYSLAEVQIPAAEANRGCTYEALAWGRYTTGPATPAPNSPHFDCGLFYGGTGGEVGQLSLPLFGVRPTAARFRLHAVMIFYAGNVSSTITLHLATTSDISTPVQLRMFGPPSPFVAAVSGAHRMTLWMTPNPWNAGYQQTGSSFRVLGGKAWRSS